MAIDADTTLAPDAVEKLLAAFDDPQVAAACGFVEPRYRQTMWERGRYIEYLLAFTFYKPIQDFYGKPLISSGCFSAYRTDVLKACGGWSARTMAEDVDLTWRFSFAGHRVRFVPEAMCYPIEPHDFHFMRKQLKRWSHGLIPVLVAARRSRGVGEVFASLPAFFLLRTVNSVFILEALWSELILRRPLLVYEKRH